MLVVCCLVHSARQDHLLTVSLSSVAMSCMESCKVHCADVLKARVLQFVPKALDRRPGFRSCAEDIESKATVGKICAWGLPVCAQGIVLRARVWQFVRRVW